MKKLLIVLSVLILSQTAFCQATEQKISEKVKIVFPGKPEEQKGANGAVVYNFTKDSTLSFMAMSLDLSPMGLTAEAVTAMGDGLWDQIKNGMLMQMPGATISKDQVTTIKGKSCLYLEIDGSNSTSPLLKGKKNIGYMFFVGALLHQVSFYSTNPPAKIDDAKGFFDSMVIVD